MKYSDIFTVRGFMTGPGGLASIETICNFMNDAAGDHCIESNLTVEDLNRIGLTWMLSRMHIRFNKMPVKGDRVRVETWPTGARGLYSCRDFRITDDSGSVLAEAASAWLTINLEKRRVVRLPDIVHRIHPDPAEAENVFPENFKSKLSEPSETPAADSFMAVYSTLDINNHVTSPVYIRWMLDALPADFRSGNRLTELEISYKAEILPGGSAEVFHDIEHDGDGFYVVHAVRSATEGYTNCIALSRWRKR